MGARLGERGAQSGSADDPASFAVAVIVLATMAMLAAWAPTSRATRMDPAVALRHD